MGNVTAISLYLLYCMYLIVSYDRVRVLLDPFEEMAVAGVDKIHVGAQLVAELVELLSAPCELLLRRECRIAEENHLDSLYSVSSGVECLMVL